MLSREPVWEYHLSECFCFKLHAWLFGNSSRTEPDAMLNIQVKSEISFHFSDWKKVQVLLTHLDELVVVNVPLGQLTLMQTFV